MGALLQAHATSGGAAVLRLLGLAVGDGAKLEVESFAPPSAGDLLGVVDPDRRPGQGRVLPGDALWAVASLPAAPTAATASTAAVGTGSGTSSGTSSGARAAAPAWTVRRLWAAGGAEAGDLVATAARALGQPPPPQLQQQQQQQQQHDHHHQKHQQQQQQHQQHQQQPPAGDTGGVLAVVFRRGCRQAFVGLKPREKHMAKCCPALLEVRV